MTINLGLKDTIIIAPFCFAMILAFILDAVFMIIPDTSSYVLLACGLARIILDFNVQTIISAVLGLIVGGLVFWIINYLCEKITDKSGFGINTGRSWNIQLLFVLPAPNSPTPPKTAINSVRFSCLNKLPWGQGKKKRLK